MNSNTKLSRPMLHAYSLTTKTPNEENIDKTFIAKEHTDMKKVLEELGYKI